jgi:hypothetical protein
LFFSLLPNIDHRKFLFFLPPKRDGNRGRTPTRRPGWHSGCHTRRTTTISLLFTIAPVSIRVLLRLGLAELCTIQESPGVVGGPTDS